MDSIPSTERVNEPSLLKDPSSMTWVELTQEMKDRDIRWAIRDDGATALNWSDDVEWNSVNGVRPTPNDPVMILADLVHRARSLWPVNPVSAADAGGARHV